MRKETADILAFLDEQVGAQLEDPALKIARDFRQRRIEKGLTRQAVASMAGVPLASVARFEQKGLISLQSLIALARAIGYLADIKGIFAEPKYSTMDELLQIRANANKKKAYPKKHD